MTGHSDHDPQWHELQSAWSERADSAAPSHAMAGAIHRRMRRQRMMWWLEGAVAFAGLILAAVLAWRSDQPGLAGLAGLAGGLVSALLVTAAALSVWTTFSRRTAWARTDRGPDGTVRAALDATRASIRLWQVHRVLTWLAGAGLSLLALAHGLDLMTVRTPVALVYAAVLVVALCAASDALVRIRLRTLEARSAQLRQLLQELRG